MTKRTLSPLDQVRRRSRVGLGAEAVEKPARASARASILEEVGAELRDMMTFLHAKRIKQD